MKITPELFATMLIATAAGVWTICIMLIAIWRAIGRLDKTSVSHEVCKERQSNCACRIELKAKGLICWVLLLGLLISAGCIQFAFDNGVIHNKGRVLNPKLNCEDKDKAVKKPVSGTAKPEGS